jgi:hypothetical protein
MSSAPPALPRLQVVVCPHPPLLFRELGGLADPVAELRAAARASLRAALDPPPEPPGIRPRSHGLCVGP